MRRLKLQEVELVNGGIGLLEAIAAFILIFTLPKTISDHKKEYAQWGQDASRDGFDELYPYDPNSNDRYGPPGTPK